jgi:hypothetical protein
MSGFSTCGDGAFFAASLVDGCLAFLEADCFFFGFFLLGTKITQVF